jgi:hypothetical protein
MDTADGLLSQNVAALLFDSRNRLWIGGANGVTLYDDITWKRYLFPGSNVSSFAEHQAGKVWIGTDRGAIRYTAGRTRTSEDGTTVEEPPRWDPFHSKNALKGDRVAGINVHGKDIWVATEEAANHYNTAEKQVLFFWEPLLPAFNLPDLWHTYFAFILPTEDWGTIGAAVNYINMGVNEWTDELDRVIGKARSWEGVFGLSYGLGLKEDLSVGLNVKYVQSALAPGIGARGEGVGRTFAVDAAILKRNLFVRNLDIGFMVENMGPSIFYVTREQSDPIPFRLMLGTAYRAVQTPVHDLKFVLDFDREIVKNYWEKPPLPFYKALFVALTDDPVKDELQEIQIHLGTEYWYVDFLALRTGFLWDYVGERYEWTFGLGLKYGNLNVDWSFIHSRIGFLKKLLQKLNEDKEGATGARHGQWRISLVARF